MSYQGLREDVKQSYFVFKGQNASTGTPNKNTGNMSFYGSVYRFKTKKRAVEWAEENDTGYTGCLVVSGTAKKMREYCLGSTMESFIDYLNYTDVEE